MRLKEDEHRSAGLSNAEHSQDYESEAAAHDKISGLYSRYAGQLTASLRKNFGDGPPDPDDIAHQAFQKLLERDDLNKIANLRAYLWRTARNLVLAKKRSQVSRSRYDFEVEQLFFPLKDDVSTPERILVAKEQLEAISDVLAEMPEKRRRVVILSRVEGLSVTDIARRLGISRPTASVHLSKGMADLAAVFMVDGESTPI